MRARPGAASRPARRTPIRSAIHGNPGSSNLEDYRIPQLGDTPEMHIHFHAEGWDHVPGGGVGLGEVATISPAASIGNAVFNATGWRPTHLPIRPDRVLEGLR